MQKKFIVSFILLFMISATPVSANEETSTGIPKVIVKAPQFQFDPVIEGAVVEHEFILENTGVAPLFIQNGNIHLMTDNPAKPEIMIPVRGKILAKDS